MSVEHSLACTPELRASGAYAADCERCLAAQEAERRRALSVDLEADDSRKGSRTVIRYLSIPLRVVVILSLVVAGFTVGLVVDVWLWWRNRHRWEGASLRGTDS